MKLTLLEDDRKAEYKIILQEAFPNMDLNPIQDVKKNKYYQKAI